MKGNRIPGRKAGSLQLDCLVALGLLMTLVLPLSYGFLHNQRLLQQTYHRAVVLELIDGELEVLLAGEWRAFPEGRQDYAMRGAAVAQLPPGRFVLTQTGRTSRLDWIPADERRGLGWGREVTRPEGKP